MRSLTTSFGATHRPYANVRKMSGACSIALSTIDAPLTAGGHMRTTLICVSIVVMVGVAGTLRGQPKGERMTVTGEAVDMWCYLEGGDRGPAKKDCATACAKAGNPIAILDARNNLFVAAGLQDHQPAHALLLGKMTEQVTVTGTVVTKGGARMI